MLKEKDEKSFCAGVYYHAYEKLGAHLTIENDMEGVNFAVWAPNAVSVSVIGDFNGWNGGCHLMQRHPMSGIYEIFIPGIVPGDKYKYEIKTMSGEILKKADPYAFGTELPPATASVVTDLSDFTWSDRDWMASRMKYAERNQPISICEVNLSDWEDHEKLVDFVKSHGFTHVEFHPVMEYLNESSGGYSTFSYFAPGSRTGGAKKLQKLINRLHESEIGVILDWCPAQFPRHESGLEKFDGTALYEIPNPEFAVHPLWDTMLYNYDSPMVKDFLIANAFFWLEVYHADGLRLDDVDAMLYLDYGRQEEQWNPNILGGNENLYAVEFLKHLNSIIKKRIPGVLLLAQEDGLWPQLTDSVENDHLGFDYKWSGGWTKDFLDYLSANPSERKNYHDQLTLSMVYAYSEHYVLTLGKRDVGSWKEFLAKMPGDPKQKETQVRAAYAYQMLHPGCKMMYPAAEMPEGIRQCITDLNQLYRTYPALYQMDDDSDGFEWIQLMKYEENILTFLRKTDKPEETLLVVCNFSDRMHKGHRVGVPFKGMYQEIFNSDHVNYGGENPGNAVSTASEELYCDGREQSLLVDLPALGVIVFSCK